MSNYIKKAYINLSNISEGIFEATIEFNKGLNILSGENGTLKTNLLRAIGGSQSALDAEGNFTIPAQTRPQQIKRGNYLVTEQPGNKPKFLSVDPKRDAQAQAFEALLATLRQGNTTIDSMLLTRIDKQIQDKGTSSLPSIGELYYATYEKRCLDGGDRRERMQAVISEFNEVVERVFPEYAFNATWDSTLGGPKLHMVKMGKQPVPVEGLSLGERDVLSLIMYLYLSRDSYEVCLIDEPELHLNWHLEEGLFRYLNDLCDFHDKQMIVVTHSRAIFREPFLSKAQFLAWGEEGKIEVRQELSEEQLLRLVGEAVQILRLADSARPIIFVEDAAQKGIIGAIAEAVGASVTIHSCRNSSNVTTLFELYREMGGWGESIFIIDGDNQGNPHPNEPKFIHLKKYCIENYLLDGVIAAKISGKTDAEVKQILVDTIQRIKYSWPQKTAALAVAIDRLTPDTLDADFIDKLDASMFLEDYLNRLGFSRNDFITKYVAESDSNGELKRVFPAEIIEYIQHQALKQLLQVK
jgi:predicted ATPase